MRRVGFRVRVEGLGRPTRRGPAPADRHWARRWVAGVKELRGVFAALEDQGYSAERQEVRRLQQPRHDLPPRPAPPALLSTLAAPATTHRRVLAGLRGGAPHALGAKS